MQLVLHCSKSPLIFRNSLNKQRMKLTQIGPLTLVGSGLHFRLRINPLYILSWSRDVLISPSPPASLTLGQVFLLSDFPSVIPESCLRTIFTLFL